MVHFFYLFPDIGKSCIWDTISLWRNHDPIPRFNIRLNEIVKRGQDLKLLDEIVQLIF